MDRIFDSKLVCLLMVIVLTIVVIDSHQANIPFGQLQKGMLCADEIGNLCKINKKEPLIYYELHRL